MTDTRKEYFKKYYQNNKDKYQKKNSKPKPKINNNNQEFKIEHKKVIITFD